MVVREKFETKAIPKSAKLIGIYFQIFSFYYETNTALREQKRKTTHSQMETSIKSKQKINNYEIDQ